MHGGVAMFESSLHVLTLIRAVANVILVTYALSINLNSGRFDFSVGSIALLSSVLSSTITLKYGLGPVPMLALSLLFGLLLGLLSGAVYITLKLPPMIISLGVALFYEGLAYSITDGHGISFINNKELLGFGTIPSYLIIIVCVLIFMVILFDQTTFGYDYKALLSGQKVAVNTGIKEKKNALICYGAAGLLMGAQGFISATTTGSIQMSLNFGSIGIMFTAFLPMFIALTYVRLMVNSSVQQVVSALLLVGFLIYLNNEQRILSLFRKTH